MGNLATRVRRGSCIQEPRFNSIEQLEGDLDLARGRSGLADDAEARANQDVGRQSKVNEVKNIEKLGAELERDGFKPTAVGKLCILGQRHVEVVKTGPPKGIAAKGPEPSLVGACPFRQMEGNGKERGIRVAEPEVVFADFAASGESRLTQLVRAVGAVYTHAGLLHPRVNRKGQAAGEGCDVQELPAGSELAAQWPQKAKAVEGQLLDEAE